MNFSIKLFSIILVFSISGVMTIHAQNLSSLDAKKNMTNPTQTTSKTTKETKNLTPFDTYKWLSKVVSPTDCQGENITVYSRKAKTGHYIFIEKEGKQVLYDESGNLYCTNSETLECRDYYELTEKTNTWKCQNSAEK